MSRSMYGSGGIPSIFDVHATAPRTKPLQRGAYDSGVGRQDVYRPGQLQPGILPERDRLNQYQQDEDLRRSQQAALVEMGYNGTHREVDERLPSAYDRGYSPPRRPAALSPRESYRRQERGLLGDQPDEDELLAPLPTYPSRRDDYEEPRGRGQRDYLVEDVDRDREYEAERREREYERERREKELQQREYEREEERKRERRREQEILDERERLRKAQIQRELEIQERERLLGIGQHPPRQVAQTQQRGLLGDGGLDPDFVAKVRLQQAMLAQQNSAQGQVAQHQQQPRSLLGDSFQAGNFGNQARRGQGDQKWELGAKRGQQGELRRGNNRQNQDRGQNRQRQGQARNQTRNQGQNRNQVQNRNQRHNRSQGQDRNRGQTQNKGDKSGQNRRHQDNRRDSGNDLYDPLHPTSDEPLTSPSKRKSSELQVTIRQQSDDRDVQGGPSQKHQKVENDDVEALAKGMDRQVWQCHACNVTCKKFQEYHKHMTGQQHKEVMEHIQQVAAAKTTHALQQMKADNHIRRVQDGVKRRQEKQNAFQESHVCRTCMIYFYGSIDEHMNSTEHKEAKDIKDPRCELCNRTFTKMSLLLRHCNSPAHIDRYKTKRNNERKRERSSSSSDKKDSNEVIIIEDEDKVSSEESGKAENFVTMDEIGFEEAETAHETSQQNKRDESSKMETDLDSMEVGGPQAEVPVGEQKILSMVSGSLKVTLTQHTPQINGQNSAPIQPSIVSPMELQSDSEFDISSQNLPKGTPVSQGTPVPQAPEAQIIDEDDVDEYSAGYEERTEEPLDLSVFNPDLIVGQEYVIPVTGFFCKLCRKFYNSENSARVVHCKSELHFKNLKGKTDANSKRVWVIGDDYVLQLAERAEKQHIASNLGLPNTVCSWKGQMGLKYEYFEDFFRHHLQAGENPHIVVVHLGSKHLGKDSLDDMKASAEGIAQLICKLIPRCKIVWSDVLPQKCYEGDVAEGAEVARKRLNNYTKRVLTKLECYAIRHLEFGYFQERHFLEDGQTLSELGLDIILQNFRDGLRYFELHPKKLMFPVPKQI